MMGMHRCGGHGLGGIGMLWIRRVIPGPVGPALVPVGSLVLAPHCDACGPRLLGSSACAIAQGLTTERTQETALSSLAIRQQGASAGVLEDLAPESASCFQHLAVLPSTVHIPQHTCRPLHEDHGPALRRVRRDLLRDSRGECISCEALWQTRRRQGKQAQRFLRHCAALANERCGCCSRPRAVSPR
jgi:hypothetical protein